jgi:hypothetical protein
MHAHSGEPPRVSVVVVAYNRRDFLPSAITSLSQQTLSRSDFEVVLVKNFQDSDLDRWLLTQGVKVVPSTDSGLGAKLAVGIELARGDVLCFLEDDDRYASAKLESVAELFVADQKLGFFHNGFELIDSEGEVLEPGQIWQKKLRRGSGSVRISGFDRSESTLPLVGYQASHNCSSISIRRSVVEPYLPYLRRVGLSADFFLFLCGLLSGLAIRADTRPLTQITTHKSNASPQSNRDGAPDWSRLATYSQEVLTNFEVMMEMVGERGPESVLHVVEGAREVEQAILDLRTGSLTRRAAFRHVRELLETGDTSYVAERRAVLPVVAAGVLSPGFARIGYRFGKRMGY